MSTKQQIKDAIATLANPAKAADNPRRRRRKTASGKHRARNARGQYVKSGAAKAPRRRARRNPEGLVRELAQNPLKPRHARRRAKRNPVKMDFTPIIIGGGIIGLIWLIAALVSQFRLKISDKLREFPNITAMAVAAPLTGLAWYMLGRNKKYAKYAGVVLAGGLASLVAGLSVGAYRRWIEPKLAQYAIPATTTTAARTEAHGLPATTDLVRETSLANMKDYRKSVAELAGAAGLTMVEEAAGLTMVEEAADCMEPVGGNYHTGGSFRPMSTAEAGSLFAIQEA